MTSSNTRELEDFREAVRERPLALFIGAGVMYPLIPLWPALLDQLLTFAIQTRLYDDYPADQLPQIIEGAQKTSRLSVYEKASLIKALLGGQYIPELQRILYRNYHEAFGGREPSVELFAVDRQYSLLHSVLRLCKWQRVVAVVSYNYDTIFSRALERPRQAYSVFGQSAAGAVGLPVYHVHGCLPDSDTVGDAEAARIVLSQDEYFTVMLEPYSWQTTTQMHYLMNATCLFLGVSLTDINMLRMISYARKYAKHQSMYCLMAEEQFCHEPPPMESFLLRARMTLCESVGVQVIAVKTFAELSKKVDFLNPLTTDPKKGLR